MTIGMITRAQTFVQEDALVENSSAVFEVLAAVLAAVMFLAAPRLIDRLLAVAVGAAGLATMSMEVSLTERTIGAGFIDGMYIDAPHDFVTLALVWATEGGWRTLAGLAATIGGIAVLVAAGRWARGHLGPDWPAVRRHPTVLLLAIAFALFVTATVLDSSREMFSFPRYYGLVLIEETMELCAGLGVLFAAIALGHPVAEPVPVAAQRRTPVAVA
jgi:hypothetical protein